MSYPLFVAKTPKKVKHKWFLAFFMVSLWLGWSSLRSDDQFQQLEITTALVGTNDGPLPAPPNPAHNNEDE
jgi:hypothetical protein